MPVTTVNGNTVTFSNSTAAANLSQTIAEGSTGDPYALTFDVLAASGGGAKATLWSVDDGTRGDDNPAVAIANPAFAGYNTDLLYRDQVGVKEISAKGAKFWIDGTGHVQYDASSLGAQLDKLGAGEIFTDTVQYTIRLANGTLSVGTLTINISEPTPGGMSTIGTMPVGSLVATGGAAGIVPSARTGLFAGSGEAFLPNRSMLSRADPSDFAAALNSAEFREARI